MPPKADPRAARGRRAERLATRHLRRQGYRIEARNWACRVGELDIVASRGDLLVFVEVRSATTAWLASPAETVDLGKQTRVARAADAYLQQRATPALRIRFDVMALRLGPWWRYELQHIEDAFTASWSF